MEVLRKRRSIREYSPQPIAKEALEKIIDAARFAPTARNIQPWQFVAVTQPQTLKKLAALAGQNAPFLAQAQACIAVFCEETKYYLEDGSAATVNILLAAADLGIGSCWVAGDKKPYCQDVQKLLAVPQAYKLASLVSLGYPKAKDALQVAEKKRLAELIHWEQF
jgi:nitroreductase